MFQMIDWKKIRERWNEIVVEGRSGYDKAEKEVTPTENGRRQRLPLAAQSNRNMSRAFWAGAED